MQSNPMILRTSHDVRTFLVLVSCIERLRTMAIFSSSNPASAEISSSINLGSLAMSSFGSLRSLAIFTFGRLGSVIFWSLVKARLGLIQNACSLWRDVGNAEYEALQEIEAVDLHTSFKSYGSTIYLKERGCYRMARGRIEQQQGTRFFPT